MLLLSGDKYCKYQNSYITVIDFLNVVWNIIYSVPPCIKNRKNLTSPYIERSRMKIKPNMFALKKLALNFANNHVLFYILLIFCLYIKNTVSKSSDVVYKLTTQHRVFIMMLFLFKCNNSTITLRTAIKRKYMA